MTRGLKNHREQRITLKFNDAPLNVWANANEMKQVVLNLHPSMRCEAVSSGSGEVRIEGRQMGKWVELSVTDNGRGMKLLPNPSSMFSSLSIRKNAGRRSRAPAWGSRLLTQSYKAMVDEFRLKVTAPAAVPSSQFFLPAYQASGPHVAMTPRGEA